MRTRTAIVLLGVVCAAMAGIAVAEEQADYTVGEFSVRLVQMITQRPGYTPEEAVAFLGRIGVKIDGEIGARVDEAILVDAFTQVGLDFTTSTPERTVTREAAGTLFGLFDDRGGSLENHFGGGADNSIKCKSGDNKGQHCTTDADCPGSFCSIPPGQAKRIVSPIDG